MIPLFKYLAVSSILVSVLFLVYYFLFRNERNFKVIRYVLLFSLIFSMILPFNQFSISIPAFTEATKSSNLLSSEVIQNTKTQSANPGRLSLIKYEIEPKNESFITNPKWLAYFWFLYLLIFSLLIFRLLISILKVLYFYFSSKKIKKSGYTLVTLGKNIIPFTFLNWIFIDRSDINTIEKQIIEHEKIHVQQKHTLDLLFSELLVAAMWFNPFIWMFKKALQQVHEYLADEGVLNSGCNKLEYQSILVNQVAEDRLIAISSNFSYSLIKKRIIMMSKSKPQGRIRTKLWLIGPVITLLFIVSSCLNDKETDKTYIAAVSPTKMNVLYLGVENPVSVAVTGADYGKVVAEIDNGTISGENGNYLVRVKKTGKATITVKVGDEIISKQVFRVKFVPDPKAGLIGIRDRDAISQEDLLKANGIEVYMENFDFNLSFEIVSFTLSTTSEGIEFEVPVEGNSFSAEQIDLIKRTRGGQKLYFEHIKAKGPDGAIRKLGTVSYEME